MKTKNLRVEIPVHFDLWMMGARFGEVKSVKKDGSYVVKMDHPQVKRLVRIGVDDIKFCNLYEVAQ